MKKSILFFFPILLLPLLLAAQQSLWTEGTTCPQDYFRSPIDGPIAIAGSFAEIRSNHFHSGLDLRTDSKIGAAVYAPADGYVSRINISAWGGGRVLYITHPNGYRTVYMHLNDFCGEIGDYVRNYQYAHHTYAFDTSLPCNMIKVKKGQLIAHTGNSGSSGGPHLHYEIRYAANDQTINPLYFGLYYTDTITPIIRNIKVYPFGEASSINGACKPTYLTPKSKHPKNIDTVQVAGNFYVGIYATDVSDALGNRNGVERIELYVDSTLFATYQTPAFLFEDTRSVNAIIDYPEYQHSHEYYIVTRRLRGDHNTSCHTTNHNGCLCFNDAKLHRLEYRVSDYKDNLAMRTFFVRSIPCENPYPAISDSTTATKGEPISYYRKKTFVQTDFVAEINEGTLYENDYLCYKNSTYSGAVGKLHRLTLQNSPLPPHKSFIVRLHIPQGIADSTRKKLLIAVISGKNASALTTRIKDDWLEASPRSWGSFAIMIDTMPPSVRAVNFLNNKTFKGTTLKVKISDNLAGIASYHCYINGTWQLAEFDGKSATLSVDTNGLMQNGTNEVKIEVYDAVGNKTTLISNIIVTTTK